MTQFGNTNSHPVLFLSNLSIHNTILTELSRSLCRISGKHYTQHLDGRCSFPQEQSHRHTPSAPASHGSYSTGRNLNFLILSVLLFGKAPILENNPNAWFFHFCTQIIKNCLWKSLNHTDPMPPRRHSARPLQGSPKYSPVHPYTSPGAPPQQSRALPCARPSSTSYSTWPTASIKETSTLGRWPLLHPPMYL